MGACPPFYVRIDMNKIITYGDELFDQPYFEMICKIVQKLIDQGIVDKGAGHCVSMSNMLHALLIQNGLKSTMVECQLLVSGVKNNSLKFVGYDVQNHNKASIDTHVVVITHTQLPILIDLSISHLLPSGLKAVISKTDNDPTNLILSNIQHEEVLLTYEQKNKYNIASLHQTSILDRIQTDQKFEKEIGYLKVLNYIGIGIGVFSILNSVLLMFGVIAK